MTHNLSRREMLRLAAVAGGTVAVTGAGGSVAGQTADSETVPMFRYDAHNSGVAPASGPKEEIDDVWTFETDDRLTAQPVVKDGTVFQVSEDSRIYAVAADSGSEEWSVGTNQSLMRTPAVGDSMIYVPTQTGRILALSVASGSGEWINSNAPGSPTDVTLTDGAVVIANDDGGSDGPYVDSFDRSTGESQWRYSVGDDESYSSRTPIVADGQIYVYHHQDRHTQTDSFEEAYVETRSSADQTVGWHTHVGNVGYDRNESSAITYTDYDGGTILVCRGDGVVLSLDATTGEENWNFSNIGELDTVPTFADGSLYVATEEPALHAIDPSIGTRQWRESLNGSPTSPVYADGVLYFGADDNYVYAHDADGGEELWNFQTGGSVVAPPVVVEGRVYAASTDGILYALGEGSGIEAPDITGDGSPAQDFDGDGLYEDVNGDGSFTAVDVQALFANLDSDAVQENPELFDFNGDGQVDVTDVQALFAMLDGEQ